MMKTNVIEVIVVIWRSFCVCVLQSFGACLNHCVNFHNLVKMSNFLSSAFATVIAPVKSLLGRRSRANTALSHVSSPNADLDTRDTRSPKRPRVHELSPPTLIDEQQEAAVVVPPPPPTPVSLYTRIMDGFKKNCSDRYYLTMLGLFAIPYGFGHVTTHAAPYLMNQGFTYNGAVVAIQAARALIGIPCLGLAIVGDRHIATQTRIQASNNSHQ
jgi:hypothetical protein